MATVVSGKELSQELKDLMKSEVFQLQEQYGRVPHLVVVLVGNNPSSISYVTGKEKACEYVGIKNSTIKLDEATTEEALINLIEELNIDESVDGILVQLPLPKHISEEKIIETIAIEKDVDGFHPLNVANLWLKKECMLPCTPKGIIKLLEKANVTITGKNAVVIGRSNIVGLPISKLLLDRNATVTIAHSKTSDLANVTSKADILIVAVGKARMLKKEMVKEGAVIIDVGINMADGVLCGDVDYDKVAPIVSAITPVPGGVGALTTSVLFKHTVLSADRS